MLMVMSDDELLSAQFLEKLMCGYSADIFSFCRQYTVR